MVTELTMMAAVEDVSIEYNNDYLKPMPGALSEPRRILSKRATSVAGRDHLGGAPQPAALFPLST